MRRFIHLIVFLLISDITFSQCWDVRDEYVETVLSLYEKADFDSIEVNLEKWRNTCEMNEELFRLSILSAIHQENPIDPFIDNHSLGYLRSYETKKMESFFPYYHAPSFSGSTLSEKLDEVTTNWSKALGSENALKALLLEIYQAPNASKAWDLLKDGNFPHDRIQKTFDEIVASSKEVNSSLMVGGGVFYDLREREVLAPQFEFGFFLFEKGTFQGFRGGYRASASKEFQVVYENRTNDITSNSLFFAFDWGFKELAENLFLYGSASHTTYLSEYFGEEPGTRKKFISSFGLGAGIAHYPMRSNSVGFNIEFMPITFETNKDFSLSVLPVSFGIKYLFGSNEPKLLEPIGYYNK